jgi:hypothetical protein
VHVFYHLSLQKGGAFAWLSQKLKWKSAPWSAVMVPCMVILGPKLASSRTNDSAVVPAVIFLCNRHESSAAGGVLG